MHHATRDGNKETELIRFRRMSSEKFLSHKTENTTPGGSYRGLAAGMWTVVMKKEISENGTAPSSANKTSDAMEIEEDLISQEMVRVRFYPQLTTEGSRSLGISKSDVYYEASSFCTESQFRMRSSEKLSQASEGIAGFPKSLVGPLSPEESGTKSDWVYGQLVVQKSNRIPKRYRGVLPTDYERHFFPFELFSKSHIKPVDPRIPESEKELFRIYRVILQKGHIRLSTLVVYPALTAGPSFEIRVFVFSCVSIC